jgi:UDPglucose 6-dehydrogenase
MIGIIGYGMVGKAVDYGFSSTQRVISDPEYNDTTIADVCAKDPKAIFVCVPTPTDGTDFAILRSVLAEIKNTTYSGLVVVKSTVFPDVLEGFDVLYNPEFLSRATSNEDFVNPPMVIIGGESTRRLELLDVYTKYSRVKIDRIFLTDIKTAALAKYTMNTFYALKVTYMNAVYDIAGEMGADYDKVTEILAAHPWMGTHHFQVPGPDGERGFGGPCLPKDTQALADKYNVEILSKVLELNRQYREK